jgi:ectoine hydroxylase-related dioxygenase (phytanoyl-CoA dioxygenase family)
MQLDLERFERDGFLMEPSLLPLCETAALIDSIERHTQTEPGRGGVRDVADTVPALHATASHPAVRSVVDQILGPAAFLVRSTLFDKTPGSNWKVPWHQDVTIAVQEKRDAEGYGPWSVKGGIVHVQPPSAVLARMVTIRIHLDGCPASNGALRVLPGTHHLGRLNQNHVDEHVNELGAIVCAAQAGEALIMRPLLLHASSPSLLPAHRRVLHFDFASTELPTGLVWRMR